MVLCGSFPNEASPKTTATKKNMRRQGSSQTTTCKRSAHWSRIDSVPDVSMFSLFFIICSFDFLSCCHFQGFIKYRHPADSCVGLKTFVYFGNNIVDSIKNLF